MSIISDVVESTKAIIKGMSVTLSYIPKGKCVVQYSDELVYCSDSEENAAIEISYFFNWLELV